MNVIGIGGFARCGKDTFVNIAGKILSKNLYTPVRVAFADSLKVEVNQMLQAHSFPFDVYTTDTVAKTKIRPLLVWWGCAKRDMSEKGLYWVNVVDKQLEATRQDMIRNGNSTERVYVLISDVRFPNEAEWLHEKWNGQMIHIRRWKNKQVRDGYGEFVDTKTFDVAPNEEEAKNDPLIQEIADVKVEWESREIPAGENATDDDYLYTQVLNALNSTKFFKHKTSGILQ